MRRFVPPLAVAALALFGGVGLVAAAPAFALADETEPSTLACTDASSDEECAAYWEHHINLWSWDYKASPTQQPQHRHMPGPFGFALINFAVFGFILYRLAGKPLREFVLTRHVTIKKDLDEAATLRAEAAIKLKEYEAKIAGIQGEIDVLVSDIRKAAEAEKARIVTAAAEQAARLQADAETEIRNEIARTRRELRREAVNAALTAAEAMLIAKLDVNDFRRLADDYVAEIEGSTPAAAMRA